MAVVGHVRRDAIEYIEDAGRFTRFSAATVAGAVREFPQRRVIVPLMMEIGVRSVGVVLATGAFIGMVLAVQIYSQLHKMGAEASSGPIINLSIVSQLGPLLAALVLAGRVGGAITAELGTMKVTEQIDALRTLGANPIDYLSTPRFLACLVLVPVLTLYSDAIGVIGGYVMSVHFFGVSDYYYWNQTARYVEKWDVFIGIAKSIFFGGAIGLISCYRGFEAGQGAEGVGRATTSSFVTALMAILIGNFFLALFFSTLYRAIYQ